MNYHWRNIVVTAILLTGMSLVGKGQVVQVDAITFAGNRRTKEKIILRELNFRVGDHLPQARLAEIFEQNRNYLLNTGLFTLVELNVADWDTENDRIVIRITVAEPLFIVPIPIFELADRNFNVWWNEYHASFKRVNYGLKLAMLNAWGSGERIKISAQFGYTPKFNVSILLPFLDNKQSVRLELSALYAQNKEVSMFNEENKQIFLTRNDQVVFKRQDYRVGLLFRPKIQATHIFRVGYSNHWVDEQLMSEANPNFFLSGETRQQYIYAEYQFRYERRNLPVLPTKGWFMSMGFVKDGFGLFDHISATYLNPYFEYHHSIAEKWVWSTAISGKVGLERDQQPYYNYRGLGYGDDFVRGYELYVVDGLDYVLLKNSLRFRVLNRNIQLPWSPFESMQILPFQFYVSANFDSGYVNDPFYSAYNSFTNRWTYGGGLGLNFLFYNTIGVQLECSVNHLGQKGVFLHANSAF